MNDTKHAGGRPPLPDAKRLRVAVQVSPAELDAARTAAAERGVSVPELLRTAIPCPSHASTLAPSVTRRA